MAEKLTPPPETYDNLVEAMAQITEAQKVVEQSKIAGFDVAASDAELKKLRSNLLKVRDGFFPGKPL